jgi:hypothetical protein
MTRPRGRMAIRVYRFFDITTSGPENSISGNTRQLHSGELGVMLGQLEVMLGQLRVMSGQLRVMLGL